MKFSFDTKIFKLEDFKNFIKLSKKPKNLTKTKEIVERILQGNSFLLEEMILVINEYDKDKSFLLNGEKTLSVLSLFVDNKVKLIPNKFYDNENYFEDLKSSHKRELKSLDFRTKVVFIKNKEEFNAIKKIKI